MPIRLSKSIKVLLGCFVVCFCVQQLGDQFFGTQLSAELSLTASQVMRHFKVWQILTYSFVHRDVMQLLFNALALAMVGSELEWAWGSRRFLNYYFTCVVAAACCFLVCQVVLNGVAPYFLGSHLPLMGATS